MMVAGLMYLYNQNIIINMRITFKTEIIAINYAVTWRLNFDRSYIVGIVVGE